MADSGLSTVIQGGDTAEKLAEMVMRIKEQKHEQATQNMSQITQMIEKGMPVDPKQAEKALKDWQKSGQSVAQRVLEGGKELVGKIKGGGDQVTPQQGQAIQAVGKAGQQASGAQSGNPVGKETAKQNPAGGVEPDLNAPQDMAGYIKSIQYRQALTNQNEASKLKTDTAINQLKEKAAQGDQGARTQLQSIGVLAYDKNFEMTASMTPEQKGDFYQKQLDIANGMESPKEKIDRESRLQASYVASGYTPGDAAVLVKDPTAKVPKTITQLGDEAKHYGLLQETFGDEAAKKIAPALAGGASLGDILPGVGKTTSHFAEQMAQKNTELEQQRKYQEGQLKIGEREATASERQAGAAEMRAKNELGQEKLELLSKQIEVKLATAENQAFAKDVGDFVTMVKQGGFSVPKDLKDKVVQDLAKKVGITKVESQGWLNYLTWGMLGQGDEYALDVEGGRKVLDESLGEGKAFDPSQVSVGAGSTDRLGASQMGLTPDAVRGLQLGMKNVPQRNVTVK